MVYVRVIKAGEVLDVYTYEKDYVYRRPRKVKRRKRISKKEANSRAFTQYRTIRSIRRARQGFFNLVASNIQKDIQPAFVTLTLNEELTLEQGYSALQLFNKKLRKRFGPNVRYIAVPEWQKKGTLHFHAVFWGLEARAIFDEIPRYYTQKYGRKRYNQYLAFAKLHGFEPGSERGTRYFQRCWARGFVDILGTTRSTLGIAGYMAKYLVKGLEDSRLANSRAYSCSRNVKRPSTYGLSGINADRSVIFEAIADSDPFVLHKISEYDTLYLGSCTHETFNKK